MFLQALIALVILSYVEGFAPLSTVTNERCSHMRKDLRTSHAAVILSASQDSNDQGEENPVGAEAEDVIDTYDFEGGFQERLKKEGGVTGVKVKAAKRSVDTASKVARRSVDSVTRDVTKSVSSDLGLLGQSEWGMTLGVLALVVVLAIGSQFASPPESFGDLSTKEQIARLADAEQRKLDNAEKVVFGMGAPEKL